MMKGAYRRTRVVVVVVEWFQESRYWTKGNRKRRRLCN
jgi:hypothetical protein